MGHLLAELSVEEGKFAEAEAHWRAALAQVPDFAPARLGLRELYQRQLASGSFDQTARTWRVPG